MEIPSKVSSRTPPKYHATHTKKTIKTATCFKYPIVDILAKSESFPPSSQKFPPSPQYMASDNFYTVVSQKPPAKSAHLTFPSATPEFHPVAGSRTPRK
ncbi:hypothetical protein JCM33374_g4606 [Metschnikowia sp. JCM 33374]|nr:hypothetical protein JCM33374_g4606 [Metschnikowia sp. JCM 33374]